MNKFSEYERRIVQINNIYSNKTKKESTMLNFIVSFGLLLVGAVVLLYLINEKWRFDFFYIIVFLCLMLILCVIAFIWLKIRHKKTTEQYVVDIEDLESTLSLMDNCDDDNLHNIDKLSIKDISINQPFVIKVLVVGLIIYVSIFVLILNLFSFSPKKWETKPEYRAYMVNDLMRQCDPSVHESFYKYNLYYFSKEELEEIFGEPNDANNPIDFEVVGDNIPYDAYYLYTDKDGRKQWLFVDYQFGKMSITLMCTGQSIMYDTP